MREEDRLAADREVAALRVALVVLGHEDAPRVVVAVEEHADHQEREIYDMFGVLFDGHHDPRRILMPEDYEGHPQRRDFPIGGEPILFTHNERDVPGWWK